MQNPKFRCSQSTFTRAEFDKYTDLFYAMPREWGGESSRPALSAIWRAGGVGAISLVPVLGLYTHAKFASEVRLSIEKLARLTGTDAGTVRKGARALEGLKLAVSGSTKHHGKRLTCWKISPELAVPRKGRRLALEYFFFSARLIFGGNWAALTGPQRAVYLAAATQARTYEERPTAIAWLRHALRDGTPWDDLERCVAAADSRGLRLASVSLDDLSAAAGVTLSTVKKAVRQLKHPSVWPGADNDPVQLRHAPLGVYPSNGGNLIYHFRDHALPWPFDDEPAEESPIMRPTPAAAVAEQPKTPAVQRGIEPAFVLDDQDNLPW